MNAQQATFYVDGMTCTACEDRITRTLIALGGVSKVKVRLQGGTVSIRYDENIVMLSEIKAAIEKAGYPVRDRKAGVPWVSLGTGLALVALYVAAGASGVFTALPRLDASTGYAALFVVGLLTSIHCIAMCGGIALTQSLGGGAKGFTRLVPGLRYNAGRIVSYTLMGGIAGFAGSAFGFSPAAKGTVMAVAGLLMVMFALRSLGVLHINFDFMRFIPPRIKNAGPFVIGLFNVLIPCGPLQSMQLYALGTGSPIGGALSMFLFSAGTVPLLFFFGSGASLLPRRAVPAMLKASAVLVLFLGAVTFARAAALTGFVPGFSGGKSLPVVASGTVSPAIPVAERKKAVTSAPVLTVADGVQTVVTEFKNGSYIPFTVKAGIPLKWTIRIRSEDLTGCNETLIVPSYGITKPLVAGDNLVEFTPGSAGVIPYSCWMGMIRSRITVTEN